MTMQKVYIQGKKCKVFKGYQSYAFNNYCEIFEIEK